MIRLAVRVPAARADEVLAALLELAPSGVEQVDRGEVVEFAVYGTPGELPELAEGEAEVGGIRVSVSGTEVADDWAERWKRFHVPVMVYRPGTNARSVGRFGETLYVRPPWEPAVVCEGVLDIAIDPGRAFGTGSHSTTRLCLELLLEHAADGPVGSACDLGCGSGVLAIAAARLGYGPVVAFDSDPLATEATQANAIANAVELDEIGRLNLREQPAPRADLVMANLMRPLLLRVAALMSERPPALIASGLLEEEADEVAAAFVPMREVGRVADKGWAALLLRI
ncbi:MAG: 50S ribosomal protein L11 methyltransferase [Thermoleophilaceae bacterium]